MRTFIRKISSSNITRVIISVILSLLLWAYVTSNEVTEVTHTFSNIQIQFVGEDTLNESKGLIVTDISRSNITVKLSGSRRNIFKLSSDNISAVVDLTNITRTGYYTQIVSISYPNDVDGSAINIVSRTPQSISFTVDKLNSKTVELRGSFNGSVAEGYTVQPIEFNPETVKISGPEEELNQISYAYVVIDRQNVDKTLSYETSYDLMDENGEKLEFNDVSLETDTVNVTLPILATKTVPLSVDVIDGGGATLNDIIVTVEPESITLSGDSALLDSLNQLTLGTIDLSEFESTYEKTFPVVISNDLQNNSGITEAKVKVEVRGLASKKLTLTNITCANLSTGFSGTVNTKSVEITVRGKENEIKSITASNIRAEADMTEFDGTGSFDAPLIFYVDGYSNVGVVGSYTAYVTVHN